MIHVSGFMINLCYTLFQQLPALVIFQYLHLVNGNLIEFDKAFTLWHTIVDKHGIDILASIH